jgi:hypothetical protein
MLGDLNACLRQLLRERGLIDARDVDIEFDAPLKPWAGALIRPTLDLFLFDIQENTELRETGMQTTRGNGRGMHRMPPRRFDLRYMVSAMTSVVADEHLLLWRALVTLMKHQTLPDEFLPPDVRALGVPVTTKVNKPDDAPRALDVWSALEAPPKPSLIYVVTVPVDLDIAIEAPLVLTRTVRYSRSREPEIRPELRTHIGGVVRDRGGAPVGDAVVSLAASVRDGVPTDAEGQFVLTGVPLGPVELRIERPGRPARTLKIEIPSESYEVVLD